MLLSSHHLQPQCRAILIGLLLPVLLCITTIANSGEAEERAKLKQVGKQITNAEKQLKGKSKEYNRLNEELKEAELESSKLNQSIDDLQKQAEQLKHQLEQLMIEKDSLEEENSRQKDSVSQQIKASYRLGKESALKLALNQENPEQITRSLKYHEYFLRARSAQLSSYRLNLKQIKQNEESIKIQEVDIASQQQALDDELRKLDANQQQRRIVLAKLDEQITGSKTSLKGLKKEHKRLETVVKRLEENILKLSLPGTEQPFAKRKGKLPWPLRGKVSRSYGTSRSAGTSWTGWLLKAKVGTSVKAIHYGRVVFSDYLRGYGLVVIVDHGGSYMTLYAHNQVLLKETGEWVLPGDTVAKVGNTGGLSAHALYFEIRRKGRPVNPRWWLAKKP